MIRIIKKVCITEKSTNKSKNIKVSIIGAKLSKRSYIFNWARLSTIGTSLSEVNTKIIFIIICFNWLEYKKVIINYQSWNIARGTTDPEIDSVTWIKFINNMAPLAVVAYLATRWRHIKYIKKQTNRILATSVSLFLARFQIWRCTKEDTPEKIHLYALTVHNHSDSKTWKLSLWEDITTDFFWKSYWLHLFDFSPLCVFKCFLKETAWIDAKSHWLHLFEFSPLCVLKCLHLKM